MGLPPRGSARGWNRPWTRARWIRNRVLRDAPAAPPFLHHTPRPGSIPGSAEGSRRPGKASRARRTGRKGGDVAQPSEVGEVKLVGRCGDEVVEKAALQQHGR